MSDIQQTFHLAIHVSGGHWIVIFVNSLGFGEIRVLTTAEMIALVEALEDEP